MPDEPEIRWHEDPAFFREAVTFTAAETGFAARLVEKDYFCTVLLHYLAATGAGLVFRGGTCLAKVHLRFYRLSEDLDFLVPTAVDASRGQRRAAVAPAKNAMQAIPEWLRGMRLVDQLAGANRSTQYTAGIAFQSVLGPSEEAIKIEVGLREPLMTPCVEGELQTLLLDPISESPLVPGVSFPCISTPEAMAEKLRAALTRREVAIRDFYDIDYAERSGVSLLEPELVELVRSKLAVPGNAPIDVSSSRLAGLPPQLGAQLEPVLRQADYAAFDLERATSVVVAVAAALS